MGTTQEILMVRVFRTTSGDLAIPDRAVVPQIEDAIEQARLHLETYLHDPVRHASERPTMAELYGMDKRIIATFRLTPSGAEPMPERRT